jgi:hypothetical protein
MASLTISNGDGSVATSAPLEALSAQLHVANPAPPISKRRASTLSIVIPVHDQARNIAPVLEQIAEYVNGIILIEGDFIDALITALRDRPDIKLVPPQASPSEMGSSTPAGTRSGLHAEPIG